MTTFWASWEMTEDEILYQNGNFWVAIATFGSGRFKPKSRGFAVYRDGTTHATRVASISGENAFERAKAEADRRAMESK